MSITPVWMWWISASAGRHVSCSPLTATHSTEPHEALDALSADF